MYRKLIKNDMRRSRLVTATITAFILVAAMLTSLAAALTVNLFGAIENLLETAKVFDILQMHTGDVNVEQLQGFAASQPGVEDFQILPFLNVEASEIIIAGESLEWSIQDNGFTVQSDKFDFLIGMDGEIVAPKDGELYVPIYYMKEGAAKLGDRVSVCGVEFTVAGFLRDSNMGQSLSSSKRFLVSAADYAKLEPYGMLEQLIEFRLADGVNSADFEAAYFGANLPANGPPLVTYALVQLMNAMTDGIMIAVLALIVILVLIVAFLCIRLTLLAKIEEDYREIGVLKALGMRVRSIKKLYLAKYGVLAGIACTLGFALSIPLCEPFMQNIRLYMGDGGPTTALLGVACGLVGAAAIYGVVLMYVNGVLRRFRKISAAQAIRFGAPQEKSKTARGMRLSNNKLLSVNAFLGIKDIFARKKLYITMLAVLCIATFILVVPQNLNTTISSKTFITYTGVGLYDFNITVMQTQAANLGAKAAEVADALEANIDIERFTIYTSKMYERIADDGTAARMRVTHADFSAFPIEYAKGTAPRTESEIAISLMNADDLGKTVGDEIVLIVDGAQKRLIVCGIYSDVTSAGRTAQAIFTSETADILSIAAAGVFNEGADAQAALARLKEEFSYGKVISTDEAIGQTFGTIIAAVRTASYAAIGVAAALTLLVTALFMKMLVAKDRYSIVILKSLGFKAADIRAQYVARSFAVLALGVIIGTILANTLGEYVGVALVSSFGASAFNFIVNPWFAYAFAPLLIALCVFSATLLGVSDIRKLKISEHIKEA